MPPVSTPTPAAKPAVAAKPTAKPAPSKAKATVPTAKTPAKPVAPAKPAVATPAAVPAAPVAPPVLEPVVREVVYTVVNASEYSKDSKEGPVTEEVAIMALNWEDENTFKKRMAEEKGTKPDIWSYGEDFMLKDEDGVKVRCWNNLDNREFDEKHSRSLAQTILNGDWAGPTTMPGETVNGSTICISRTGKVESGQHSLAALILACQMYRKNPDAYPFWQKLGQAPVIETIIVTGISESSRVIMTVDNCKQRSLADVFYTSELFRDSPAPERKVYARMMAGAGEFLWKRTNAKGYRTLPEMVAFQERHKRLLKCVEHLFAENSIKSGRPIDKKIMNAGHGAAICYLMGCSAEGTDGDVYRNGFPPTEKGLDWKLWDRAKEFWAMVAGHEQFVPVRAALHRLKQTNVYGEGDLLGFGGSTPEVLAILQKAWDVWSVCDPTSGVPPFSDADLAEGGALRLAYNNLDAEGNVLPDGQLALLDRADFRGIDVPEDLHVAGGAEPEPEPPVDIEAAKEEERKRRQDIAAKVKAAIPLGKKK